MNAARLKLVEVIADAEAARLLADPMRRAILNILRRKALTQAELAESLGLTDATVNHHLKLLKRIGLLSVAREEVEAHGIVQKFYTPSAFLYIPDIEKLPKEVARYYYPINIERVRGILSVLPAADASRLRGKDIDALGEEFTRLMVKAARKYANTTVREGRGEEQVQKMYREALAGLRPLLETETE